MNTWLTRLNLYDVLSFVLPGFVLCNEILYCFSIPLYPFIEGIISIFSFVVGLCLHSISEEIWNRMLRNNLNNIQDEKHKFTKAHNAENVQQLINKTKSKSLSKDNTDQLHLSVYNIAYYYVCEKMQHGATIKTLEYHIAFGRNMIIPLFMGIFVSAKYFWSQECFARYYKEAYVFCSCPFMISTAIIVVIIALLCHTLPKIQKSIYRCVFEDYEYLKNIENAYDKQNIKQ